MSETRPGVWTAQTGKPGMTHAPMLPSLPPTTQAFSFKYSQESSFADIPVEDSSSVTFSELGHHRFTDGLRM